MQASESVSIKIKKTIILLLKIVVELILGFDFHKVLEVY